MSNPEHAVPARSLVMQEPDVVRKVMQCIGPGYNAFLGAVNHEWREQYQSIASVLSSGDSARVLCTTNMTLRSAVFQSCKSFLCGTSSSERLRTERHAATRVAKAPRSW
jgi:hypothetical protein